jgi:hypothetical protein
MCSAWLTARAPVSVAPGVCAAEAHGVLLKMLSVCEEPMVQEFIVQASTVVGEFHLFVELQNQLPAVLVCL